MPARRGIAKELSGKDCLQSVGHEINRAQAGARLLQLAKVEALDMDKHLVAWVEHSALNEITDALATAITYIIATQERTEGLK